MKPLKLLLVAVLSAVVFCGNVLADTLGDYDGDGKSDVSTVEVKRTGKKKNRGTIWNVRLTGDGSTRQYKFSKPGDALVQGEFYGDGKTYPGIVFVKDAKKPLVWYVKNQDGSERSFNFGMPGDHIPNQGDLDCDGRADNISITNSGNSRVWHYFSSLEGRSIDVTFGGKNDRVGVADMNGDGCAELVALNSSYNWSSRSVANPSTTTVQWGSPGDIPVLPADFNNDGRADYVVARPGSTNQTLLLNANTYTETRNGGNTDAIPMVGNFIGANFLAWIERKISNFSILNSNNTTSNAAFGNTKTAIVRPDGTVVQPDDNGRFGTAPSNPSNPSNPGNNPDCDNTEGTSSSGSSSRKFWNSQNSRGVGKVNNDADLTGNISDIKFYDASSGSEVDDADFGGYEYGGRERWYGDKKLGSLPREITVKVFTRTGTTICYNVGDVRRNWFLK